MKREFLPSGWWYTYPSEKYEFVSWADDSQYMEKITNVPNHQPDLGQLIKLVGFDPCPTQSSSDFGVYRWPQGATKTPCPLPPQWLQASGCCRGLRGSKKLVEELWARWN